MHTPLNLDLQLHRTLSELYFNSLLVYTGPAGSSTFVPKKPRHQHNGTPKGFNSPAQQNTLSAIAHRPDVFVSNVTLDITTGAVATPTLTPGDILQLLLSH